ncbi:beta-lactamase/transpeptidase-like protein [Hyaloraphidium curvatum]|nr:beta-lactamase/transpeptidase-like protein [Hyaloraphidium curvatum]KAI9034199.1 beta-lactamase/transpeptidase-like protein [Hyaloraphidium curvatum]
MAAASKLAVAAAATAGGLLLSLAAAYRVLRAGAYSPWSHVLLGTPAPEKASKRLQSAAKPDGTVAVDIETEFYSVTGTVDAAYTDVVDVFCRNVAEGHEVGASFCVYVGERRVVDLAGGQKVGGRKYDLDSCNQVFSSGKAIMSVIVAYCVGKGYLSYDDLVTKYWPEFGQGGKEHVTVKEILQHRAGVGWLDPENRLTYEECWDLDAIRPKLERQKHNFDGVKTQSYHAVTRGYYMNEILRRVHPQGYTARDIMSKEILPLLVADADRTGHPVHISVPEDPAVFGHIWDLVAYPIPRVVLRLFYPRFANPDPLPEQIVRGIRNPNPIANKSMAETMPTFAGPDPVTGKPVGKGLDSQNSWNVRRGQHTSFAVVTNARAMARLGALIANGGKLEGREVIPAGTVGVAMEEDPWSGEDRVLRFEVPFTNGGWGITKGRRVPQTPSEQRWIDQGTGWKWVGWAGYGGSMMQWEPEKKIAFGYAPSALQISLLGDFRSARLLETALDCWEAAGGKAA